LYEFVKAYGTDFYGKKFLVGLPFVLSKTDSETLQVSYTQEITDGGWQSEGSAPLGLSLLNEDVFKIQDGRFRAFVAFGSIDGLDTARVSPQDSVIQDNTLYLRVTVERDMVALPSGQPAALVTLGGAVYEEAQDAFGGFPLVANAVLGMDVNAAQPILAADH